MLVPDRTIRICHNRAMHYRILVMEVEIRLLAAHSLKDKRQLRRSLVERLRGRFNLSVTEIASQALWNRLELGIAYVAINQATAEQMRDKIEAILDEWVEPTALVVRVDSDIS